MNHPLTIQLLWDLQSCIANLSILFSCLACSFTLLVHAQSAADFSCKQPVDATNGKATQAATSIVCLQNWIDRTCKIRFISMVALVVFCQMQLILLQKIHLMMTIPALSSYWPFWLMLVINLLLPPERRQHINETGDCCSRHLSSLSKLTYCMTLMALARKHNVSNRWTCLVHFTITIPNNIQPPVTSSNNSYSIHQQKNVIHSVFVFYFFSSSGETYG